MKKSVSVKKGIQISVFMAAILYAGITQSYAEEYQTIQIKGSDTMVNLGQAWAEEFMLQNPEVSIAVNGGGSGTGIAAIISGTTDIAQSSRDMTKEEIEKANQSGEPIQKTIAAYDGIVVVVHPSNPVSQLTIAELSDIFTGKVKNWKDLGGEDLPILVLSRERNSGTHVYFLEEIVRKGNAKGPEEFGDSVLMMPSTQAIVQEVKTGKSAIGYIGMGYVSADQKVVKVSRASGQPYVVPNLETVQSGEYPIARSLNFYTHGTPKGVVKDYIDFVLGEEGQEIVRILDFVPLNKN